MYFLSLLCDFSFCLFGTVKKTLFCAIVGAKCRTEVRGCNMRLLACHLFQNRRKENDIDPKKQENDFGIKGAMGNKYW